MIAIVSSHAAERSALTAVCDSRGWVTVDCDSVRGFKRAVRYSPTRVVLTRQKLLDGYSDDVIGILAASSLLPATRIIVLLDAGTSTADEARQVALGADYVHRDPARVGVLLEYLSKYSTRPASENAPSPQTCPKSLTFAGASVLPLDRIVQCGGKSTILTPREMELLDLLADAPDAIVTYQTLYSEILGRKFRGETSNMRVLLGKLVVSFAEVDCPLRMWIDVIPKTGYRYRTTPQATSDAPPLAKTHPRKASAATAKVGK